VKQQPLRIIERPLDKNVGDHLWHGSVLMANSILVGKVRIPEVQTIIEVGAGCGLVSLSIAQMLLDSSKRIIATDLQDIVDTTMSETLQADISTASRIERKPLEWGNQDDIERLLASIHERERVWLVAADVLYNPASHEELLKSLRQLSQHFTHSCITIAYRPRSTGDINFFGLASKAGFDFKVIFQHADVQMWHYEGI
jgi:predicted nicotinamide N-methyase